MSNVKDQIEHRGGGYYKLSSGETVRGKKNALKKQKELNKAKKDAYKDIELDDGTVIEVDSWNERKNYHCPVCPYADLELVRLKDHILNNHTTSEREDGDIIRTDRFGNELN